MEEEAAIALDAKVRRHVYDVALRRGAPPSIAELMEATTAARDDVGQSLARLASGRVLVLQPGSGEILMAAPFSAIPTPFVVRTRAHVAYANCAWDALGVSVMTRTAAHVFSACGCCGEALTIDTSMEGVPDGSGIIHFAVPARRWWDDIVFT